MDVLSSVSIPVVLLILFGVFFMYLGCGGPLPGKSETAATPKFGIPAILVGSVLALVGVVMQFMQMNLESDQKAIEQQQAREEQASRLKTEAQTAEQVRLKAEAEAKVAAAEQARLKTEAEAKIAAAEQARLQAETEAKSLVEQARLKTEAEAKIAVAEQARLQAEAEANRARLKAEAEQQARRQAEAKVAHAAEKETLLPPHFDCAKASSAAEKMICGNNRLSDADGRLGKVYSQLEKSLSFTEKQQLREDQKGWLEYRDQQLLEDCKKKVDCAVQVYEDRMAELASWKPHEQTGNLWWGVVTTEESDPLNIRAAMDTRSAILEKVDKGTKLQVLEEHDKWYKVQLDNGRVGYAASTFIQPERLLYEKSAQQWGIVTTEKADLNIRAEMKADALVLKKVKKHAKVLILENHGEWYKVKLEDGTIGYAASEFISKSAP